MLLYLAWDLGETSKLWITFLQRFPLPVLQCSQSQDSLKLLKNSNYYCKKKSFNKRKIVNNAGILTCHSRKRGKIKEIVTDGSVP